MTRAKGRREMAKGDKVKDESVTDETTDDVKQETVERGFYNQHEGLRGRDPNVMYLDMAERVHGAQTAHTLGFDVDADDLGNLPVTAGTPLVVRASLGDNITSHPNAALLNEGEGLVTDPVLTADVPVEEAGTASPFSGTRPESEPANVASTSGTTAGTPAVTDADPLVDPLADPKK